MVTQTYPSNTATSLSPNWESKVAADSHLRALKVLLVGNYEFDGSISMKIWADALQRELIQH